MEKKLRLYSNTSLSDYKTCARMFYYRYIREWAPGGKATALAFGGAWHRAMDVVWQGLLKEQQPPNLVAEMAYSVFVGEWITAGMTPPEDIDMEEAERLSPRTPMIAREMIYGYIEQRASMIADMELVEIEKPFAVPLDPADASLFYVGKIDKVVRYRKRITGIEHKSTTSYAKSNNLPFQRSFLDSFNPNSQVDGYLYALHMYYPGEVGGVWVDGALVHKTNHDGFVFLPIEHQLQQLDLWLWETRSTVDQIEANMARVAELDPNDRYMAAFPRDTSQCMRFNVQCAFLHLCRAWPNPIGRDMPSGFTHKAWNPLEHLNASKMGLPK